MKLWLDDIRTIPEQYDKHVYTVEEAQTHILNNKIEKISIDNDLGKKRKEGYKLIDWLEEKVVNGELNCFEINVHSANPFRKSYIQKVINRIYYYCSTQIYDYSWEEIYENFPLFCSFVEETYVEYNENNELIINFDNSFYSLIYKEFGIDLNYGYVWAKLEQIEEILEQKFDS